MNIAALLLLLLPALPVDPTGIHEARDTGFGQPWTVIIQPVPRRDGTLSGAWVMEWRHSIGGQVSRSGLSRTALDEFLERGDDGRRWSWTYRDGRLVFGGWTIQLQPR